MMQDLHNNIDVTTLIPPQTQTNSDTAIVSSIIDTAGFNKLELVLQFGGMTDANVTLAVLVEDGENPALSDNAAVPDEFLLGTEALATPLFSDDNKVSKIGYIGPKRYVRVTVTPSGNNSGALPIAGLAIRSGGRKKPHATQLQT